LSCKTPPPKCDAESEALIPGEQGTVHALNLDASVLLELPQSQQRVQRGGQQLDPPTTTTTTRGTEPSRRQWLRLKRRLRGCPNYLEQIRPIVRLTGAIAAEELAPDAVDDLTQLYRCWRDET
jgi:hypothetical protein